MTENELPKQLQSRLHLVIENVSNFWEQSSHHQHFTFQGYSHSKIVYDKLANLIERLPKDKTILTNDELFIVSAAAWLYEIGLQCTSFKSTTLAITWRPGITLSFDQLQEIRDKKHELSSRMILDSVHTDYESPRLQLGLQDDDYTVAIAAVCRWCSDELIDTVPEMMLVNDKRIRLRLLVALLRLADQLYVSYTRVNVERLQSANLKAEEKARWWAYHHTTILPIGENMLIPFHYYLAEEHMPLLNLIRTLIEPDFRPTNPVIEYLWKCGLTLASHNEPGVDPPTGARQPMTEEMRAIVRSIKTDEEIQRSGAGSSKTPARENSLLVLDHENFLLELGQEGYFPAPAQIKSMLFNLLKVARRRHTGFVTGLAAAHWNRPDLRPIADMLEEVELYELLKVEDQQKGSEALLLELQKRLQNAELPGHVILVAPQTKMIRLARKFHEARQPFSAWLNDTPDVGAYHSLADQFPRLVDILELTNARKINPAEQDLMETACILRLEDRMRTDTDGTVFSEVSSALQQIGLISGSIDWWHLYLIHEDILHVAQNSHGYISTFNSTHPKVKLVQKKRTTVIDALQSLKQAGSGVPENILLNELLRHPVFQGDEHATVRFLDLLQEETTISVDRHPSELGGQPLWQLNPTHWPVVNKNAGHYLPLFLLGFDHALARNGFPGIHEHTLKNRLRFYMEHNAVEAAYQLALERKLMIRREASVAEKQRYHNDALVNVELAADQDEVQKILLSRDILLDILRVATYRGGMQRDALKHALGRNHRFTRKLDEIDDWLAAFQSEGLVLVDREVDSTSIEHDCIKLNFQDQLLHYLLGRMHVHGVVMVMRILRATRPEAGKTASEITDMLANRVTRGNRDLARWAFEYARHIRLIGPPRFVVPDAVENGLILQKHRFVERLEIREADVCKALKTLVERLSRPHVQNGWVPLYTVIQRMEQDPQQFGYTHGEYDFWINRTIAKYGTLQMDGRNPQTPIRPKTQEQQWV